MESRKGKMDRKERARQFMPFDALQGLREALEEKEKAAENGENVQQEEDNNKRMRKKE